ncbi:hypothetical protein V6N12_035557 [Hibiscus sabdariffa]|uniref:Secreted protein n=1 Tax=Hibiscus sabdariffa TaxID=183260 RepID=A0ABR2EN26_9ROSI
MPPWAKLLGLSGCWPASPFSLALGLAQYQSAKPRSGAWCTSGCNKVVALMGSMEAWEVSVQARCMLRCSQEGSCSTGGKWVLTKESWDYDDDR